MSRMFSTVIGSIFAVLVVIAIEAYGQLPTSNSITCVIACDHHAFNRSDLIHGMKRNDEFITGLVRDAGQEVFWNAYHLSMCAVCCYPISNTKS